MSSPSCAQLAALIRTAPGTRAPPPGRRSAARQGPGRWRCPRSPRHLGRLHATGGLGGVTVAPHEAITGPHIRHAEAEERHHDEREDDVSHRFDVSCPDRHRRAAPRRRPRTPHTTAAIEDANSTSSSTWSTPLSISHTKCGLVIAHPNMNPPTDTEPNPASSPPRRAQAHATTGSTTTATPVDNGTNPRDTAAVTTMPPTRCCPSNRSASRRTPTLDPITTLPNGPPPASHTNVVPPPKPVTAGLSDI